MPATLEVALKYFPLPVGAKYATLKDDAAAVNIEDALSFSFFDKIISRGRNFRNLVSAGDLGRAWASGANYKRTLSVNFNQAEELDDRMQQVDPRDEQFTVTYLVFWSGATGSGNVVALIERSLFEQFSKDIPVRY